jgi:hypothetical protein
VVVQVVFPFAVRIAEHWCKSRIDDAAKRVVGIYAVFRLELARHRVHHHTTFLLHGQKPSQDLGQVGVHSSEEIALRLVASPRESLVQNMARHVRIFTLLRLLQAPELLETRVQFARHEIASENLHIFHKSHEINVVEVLLPLLHHWRSERHLKGTHREGSHRGVT